MPFIIFTMFICIVVAIFTLQNSVVVPVKFVLYEAEASLAIVILLCVFLGFLIGASMTMYIKIRHFWSNRKKDSEIKELSDENLLLTKRVEDLEKQIDISSESELNSLEPENETK